MEYIVRNCGPNLPIKKWPQIAPCQPLRATSPDLHADLDAHGYCLVADAMSPADRTVLREKFERQWEAEARIGRGLPNPAGVHSSCNLLVKGEIFQKTVLQPVVDELMEYLLGDGFLISSICGLQTVPGSKAQGLHTDQFLFGIPADFSLVANAFFMIDEFTEENGGDAGGARQPSVEPGASRQRV